LRTAVRLLTLSAAVAVLLGVLPWPAAPKYVASASPFVAVCSGIATRSFPLAFAAGLAVAAACLVRPRWFCRWACPVGLLVEGCAKVGRAGNAGIPARGSSASRSGRLPAIGQWAFWITLGGAVAGYPLLLWMDPLALLAGAAGPRESWAATAAACVGIGLVLVTSLVWGMLWCSRLCPLGTMQDVLSGLARAVTAARAFRPLASRSGCVSRPSRPCQDEHRSEEEAHGQALGAPYGDAGAAAEEEKEKEKEEETHGRDARETHGRDAHATGLAARRAVLVSAAALAAGVGIVHRAAGASGPLRPPGAIEEERFTGVCIRCGACIRACPAHILRTDLAGPVHGWLAPRLVIAGDYCRADCNRCTQVCPSGAIQAVDLARKQAARIGLARIDLTTCWLAAGRECTACIRSCPYEAIESVFDERTWASRPVVHAQQCNGCGACELACPVAPKAVRVNR